MPQTILQHVHDQSWQSRRHPALCVLPIQGKKAGKMEDGMAEAQAQAAGCLRLLSLSDVAKVDVMAAGAVRFLTPLLESKLHHARWNARQVWPMQLLRCMLAKIL